MWLAQVGANPSESIGWLRRALEIDPANQRAREGLAHFVKSAAPAKPAAARPGPEPRSLESVEPIR
jgi:hypothetical protein